MANKNKYLSFKYAHDRLKTAIDNGYFLEAVMIEESIISDRLHSASGTSNDPINKKTGRPKYINLKVFGH